MCGIVGYWDLQHKFPNHPELISSMAKQLLKRGPDSAGQWQDPEMGLALGHRRLSIIDKSDAGHQPAVTPCGRYILSYNGEIYNSQVIAKELSQAGVNCRGYSDTEVLLQACAYWGVQVALLKLIGMFAFALWDRREKNLTLVRDRVGIKPLYWGQQNGVYFFSSQLKALSLHPAWQSEIDKSALASFFQLNYIPGSQCIFQGMQKVLPGQIVEIDVNGVRTKKYWDLSEVAKQPKLNTDTPEALSNLEVLLRDSVNLRMISDVPLGAFLSGGVDSSLVTSLMQSQSMSAVKTFSIGFEEAEYNEAPYARRIADYLGTSHCEYILPAQEAMQVIPELPDIYDEPFADASQIPMHLVAKLAKKSVTVALSGDGGDESFAGYNRHLYANRLSGITRHLPLSLRKSIAKAIQSVKPQRWNTASKLIPSAWRPPQFGDKINKLAQAMSASQSNLYEELVSLWPRDQLVLNVKTPALNFYQGGNEKLLQTMQLMDSLMYLPDDILTKVDRATMAVSLEARVPLLDHRVVEYAWQLPDSFKIQGGQSKWALRQILNNYLPPDLTTRPKMGFALPIADWLRTDLRDWAESLLDPEILEADGLLNSSLIRSRWQEHLAGSANWEHSLWGVLMFQAWKQHWFVSSS